jgi:hypothetical protein
LILSAFTMFSLWDAAGFRVAFVSLPQAAILQNP